MACWHGLLGGPSCALGPIPTPQGGATSLFFQNTGEPMPNFFLEHPLILQFRRDKTMLGMRCMGSLAGAYIHFNDYMAYIF